MRSEIANNHAGKSAPHADELRARNRRVGLMALAIALLLALGTAAYVAWRGGAGTAPWLRSALDAVAPGGMA